MRTRKLVVIDDDEDDYIIVRDLLERQTDSTISFSSQWISNAEQGIEALLTSDADVFLLDYRIGAASGIDLLREATEAGVRTPIIMLTGQNNAELDAEAIRAGAADFLVKNQLDTERLTRSIRYALDRHGFQLALLESEDRYKEIFERNPIPLYVYDCQSMRFLAVNEAAVDHYGYSRSDFMAMTVLDIRPEEDRQLFRNYVETEVSGLSNEGLWRHVRRDGSVIDVETWVHSVEFNNRPARIVLAKDVTAELGAKASLREREMQLRQILRDASDGLVVVDSDQRISYANHAAGALFGKEPDSMVGSELELDANPSNGEIEFTPEPGNVRVVESRISDTTWDGAAAKLVSLRDVTDRRHADERQQLLERAIDSSLNGVIITDARNPDFPVIYVNQAFERITGYSVAEVVGKNLRMLQGRDRSQPEQATIRATLAELGECEVVIRNYRKDGTLFWNHLSLAPVRNSKGEVTHYIGVQNDLTERRRYETELAYLATHDTVTGLPRFLAIEEFTIAALEEAQSTGRKVFVFYLGVDRFHGVNETMGHAVGDQALRVVADRLRRTVANTGQVARIGGDEFVAIVQSQNDDELPLNIAESIRRVIELPIEVDPYTLYLTCSVGISVAPEMGNKPNELLRQAEAAMNRAKRQGRNSVCAFSFEHIHELEDRLSLGGMLRDAVRNHELVLHYQPQLSALNGEILGLEALVRWASPQLGLVPPGRFIGVAEDLGLIVDIGLWVLESACTQARKWVSEGHENLVVAVNVSALQLQRPTFVDDVKAVLHRTGLPARNLELELTESSIMENVTRMLETMHALKGLGITLALDDFGIGYSSLNYLKRFPIDRLKMDQSFVQDVTLNAGDAAIVRAIIAMGHQLQMTVMAEGVETLAQMGYLRRNHCDQFQGILFSPAVPVDEANALLKKRYLSKDEFVESSTDKTILLLDDEENILRALSRTLRRDGYRILTANSAKDAFELLGRNAVQVVVSDQRMPDTSGTEFLSLVKDMYPNTIRLVLSGYTDLKTLTEAINHGAIYKFLTKPWDDNQLRQEIQGAFRAYSEHRTSPNPSN